MSQKLKWIAVMVIVISCLWIPESGLSQSINWKSYADGILLSKQKNKKVFLHFMTDWCGYCKKMDLLTFSDERVIQFLNDHFVSIKVDGDRETQIRDSYKVTGYPDNRFLGNNRKQINRLPGFIQQDSFLFYLEYIHTDSYKTMSPMEYYKSR